jgi:hypothetical protein
MPHSILLTHLRALRSPIVVHRWGSVRVLGASRSKFSSMGAWGATAGNVKLLLPPRQSRGISFASLGAPARDLLAEYIGRSVQQQISATLRLLDIVTKVSHPYDGAP